MGVLVETIYGNSSKTMLLPGNVTSFVPTQPLAMTMLDSLTIHAKMRYEAPCAVFLILNKTNAYFYPIFRGVCCYSARS